MSFDTLQYYAGTQNGVLIIEVSAIHRFVIERFHCSCKLICGVSVERTESVGLNILLWFCHWVNCLQSAMNGGTRIRYRTK